MSREFAPRRHSGTTRNPRHDLFLSHRGGLVFDLPSLPPLALGPDLIPIPVDPGLLRSRVQNDYQPREMQIPADPTATQTVISDCGPEERSSPRERDLFIDYNVQAPPDTTATPTVHVFQTVHETATHIRREVERVESRRVTSN